MIPITYLKGDATRPVGDGTKLVVHCCNDIGAWGAGFVLALSRRWPEPECFYRQWAEGIITRPTFALGEVQVVPVEAGIAVVNLIGQHGTGWRDGVPPIRYGAITTGLNRLRTRQLCLHPGTSVHMPRMGCGLAGGEWSHVERIIIDTLSSRDVPVFIYDLH
ncbi:MAG: Appr-1-p processing protein [Opitutaceae bacterium]|jgi:O-acetyl-ADP-ribose deacetylase (regulator of RNase III)|nr:Appr-1-p processing protein [Opitutaceae bacterium]